MNSQKGRNRTGSTKTTDSEINRLVAETLLAKAIRRNQEKDSRSPANPPQTSPSKKPSE